MNAVIGTNVDILTQDGTADAYLAHPADDAVHPGVLFYMDAFGLRPQLKRMADRLAGAGYTVLVPNVVYRHGRAPVVPLPEHIGAADRPAVFERLVPIMRALTPDLAMRDAGAYLSWLAAHPLVTDGPVGVTGYCMGAGLALRTAGTYPDRVAAAAGVRHRTEIYTGTNHGYTMADTAAHDAEATERHWTALLDLLSRTLDRPRDDTPR